MSVTITNLDTKMTWHFDRSVRSTTHPFVVANQLVPTSYISLEMVLGYYSLIPEYVAVITSVTMGLPLETENRYGRFIYQQMDTNYFLYQCRSCVCPNSRCKARQNMPCTKCPISVFPYPCRKIL